MRKSQEFSGLPKDFLSKVQKTTGGGRVMDKRVNRMKEKKIQLKSMGQGQTVNRITKVDYLHSIYPSISLPWQISVVSN